MSLSISHNTKKKSSTINDNSNQELRSLTDSSSIQQHHNIDVVYRSSSGLSSHVRHKLQMIAGFGFAQIGSVITWIVFVVWLFNEQIGGLGLRSSSGVTAAYFNWHIFCMSTAFLLFMTTSILSFELMPFKKYTNKNIHWITNTCAFILALSGFSIIIDCHQILSDSGSFMTVHSIVGLTTLLLFTANYMHGMLVYLFHCFGCQDIGGWGFFGLSHTSRLMHKRIGLMVVLFGFTNMLLGLQEKNAGLTGTALLLLKAITAGIIVVLVGIVSNLVTFRNKFNKFIPIPSRQSVPNEENQDYGTNDRN